MDSLNFVGQTLDGKYQIERELGRGGMGTVYLANHLGTERPVAIKIISPQFMERVEFVERFRREARAAGRLRHPNVVNVTDFGFAGTSKGQVAYLVMEYLDGCTLGEILDEERNLPVVWTLDILEQVCSAVNEAHCQGIIHRDLKPDNIWLEPNQRGGYTVKVLDFGIAKLEEHSDVFAGSEIHPPVHKAHTLRGSGRETMVQAGKEDTFASSSPTKVSEAVTLAQTVGDEQLRVPVRGTVSVRPINTEGKTVIFNDGDLSIEIDTTTSGSNHQQSQSGTDSDSTGRRSLYDSRGSAELTSVGAVLGTPLYMSPEQCRGEHLDARSDIYSLGVIAYQMLSGAPPFTGDFAEVMESHKSTPPKPLAAKGIRRKMARAIDSALEKDPKDRPQTAEAFANVIRSRSEGIWALLRRAMVIYSEHLPKFIGLAGFFYIPVVVLTILQVAVSFMRVSDIISGITGKALLGLVVSLSTLASAFCSTLIVGSIVWVVTQYLAIPLRPIRLRPVLKETRANWKKISASGAMAAFTPILACFAVGLLVFGIVGGGVKLLSMALGVGLYAPIVGASVAIPALIVAFFVVYVWCMLVTAIAMMEKPRIRDAFRRSKQLTDRAFVTALAAALIMFLVPMLLASTMSFIVAASATSLDPPANEATTEKTSNATGQQAAVESDKNDGPQIRITRSPSMGTAEVSGKNAPKDMRSRVKHTILESLIQIFWLPIQIIMLSFSGIIVALLYLKTRLAAGESMDDLIERFEDDGRPRKKWQERVRQRLIQSGRIPSRS